VQSPEACPALVLNADYRPLSYYPLSLWSWQDAVKAVFMDRVQTLSQYDQVVRSPSDSFACQYCGSRQETRELTFDHVVPRSRGGRTSWENVVTACSGCNMRKANRTPREAGMPPIMEPAPPTTYQLRENGRAFPPNYLHEDWRDYLYWDSELESD